MAQSNSIPISRRRFLQTSAAASALFAGLPLVIRPVKAASDANLTAGPARVSLVGEGYPETLVWAFNSSVPGPVIRAVQGERLKIGVTNELSEPTTVHWHGLRVPVGMDGVPYLSQPLIEPGQTFAYEFDLPDAGTYWYHPHINSSEQVGRGLYGALIVEEADPPEVDRELLWVLDDWRLDRDAKIAPFDNTHDASHNGRIGNSATINGQIVERQKVRAGERIRLRLINAANARTFGLEFRDLNPWIVALDGQPVQPHRLDDGSLVLGASMRADLIIDMHGDPGSESLVVDGHYGPEYAYELIRFAYTEEAPLREVDDTAPNALSSNPIAEPDLETAERHHLVFEGGAMGGMASAMMGGRMMGMRELAGHGRLWAINGSVPDDVYREPPLLQAATGTSHIIEMVNRTAFEHPIHLHGHTFRVISRNGQDEPYRPFRDTVLLGVDETLEIAFVADNPGKWMFHCHVLEHQGSGMMGVVDVA
ncbi:MAG: multicopper oxidase domain-containing protein [Geminicoccaceae bacterium]